VNGYVETLLGNPSAVDELHKKGLKCFHAEPAQHATVNSCPHTVPLEEMATHLSEEVLGTLAHIVVAFNQPSEPRLASAASSSSSSSASSSGHADDPQVTELRKKIEDAFIFSCPNCAATAQEHDACCSVKCGNKGCNSNFCSLCFKNFGPGSAGSTNSHRHVREVHTGESAFEYRSDEFDELDADHHKTRWFYEKRYQWLLTRKKLDSILTAGVKPGIYPPYSSFPGARLPYPE
jgi:hypothetical protein